MYVSQQSQKLYSLMNFEALSKIMVGSVTEHN